MSEFNVPWIITQGMHMPVFSEITDSAPETWNQIRDSQGDVVAEDMSDKYATRIVAAVNFCRNLPTDWLQKHVAAGVAEFDVSPPGETWLEPALKFKELGE